MAPVTSSKKGAPYKPYTKASTSKSTLPTNAINLGAPSQPSQSSRKGKKAWRKNVDITAEEGAMEAAREEERVTGGPIVRRNNEQLFTIDTTGDIEVAKRLRRAPKPLRSLANLTARSAVPSLSSRPTSSTLSRKIKLTPAERTRLRRIARRTLDPTPSADIHTLTSTPLTDAWHNPTIPTLPGNYGNESIQNPAPRAPITLQRQREVYLSNQVEGGRGVGVVEGGSSYNPSAGSHAELMARALREEAERLEREAIEAERVKIGESIMSARRSAVKSEYADGMVVGPGEIDDNLDNASEDGGPISKKTKRKTQAQRNKALRRHEELQRAKLVSSDKKLLKSIPLLKALEASLVKREKEQKDGERLARLAKRERERIGLVGGEKIGKYRVKKGVVDVQLGEDLAETLRQLKPEGNLFKDRFLALQKKALLEPRVPQLPKRKSRKTMTYEKHPYKRFK